MGVLYMVATPVGNLEDISLRALRVLKEVDVVLCEDTRVAKKLLAHYGIEKRLMSYHQHSKPQRIEGILDLLKGGKTLAVVSDAGTPGISDPGSWLVREVADRLPEVAIVPIPGASAVAAMASVAGFSMDRFLFLGFPPAKKGRKKFFEHIAQAEYPVVLYESSYRIVKTLGELPPSRRVAVGRELTKKFETIYRGPPTEVIEQLGESPRGEFVLAVVPVGKF